MTHTIASLLHSSFIVSEDPNARAWTAVQWSRDVKRVTGMTATVSETSCGRPCVDSLPWESFATLAPSFALEVRAAFADDTALLEAFSDVDAYADDTAPTLRMIRAAKVAA